jgi:hypothetical protein
VQAALPDLRGGYVVRYVFVFGVLRGLGFVAFSDNEIGINHE